jgi:pyruvate, water dikinase
VTGPPLALPLAEVGAGDRGAVGGKGASLGELLRAGVRVPAGWVVTTAAFGRAMRAVDPQRSVARAVAALDPDDHERVARVTAAIRGRVLSARPPAGLAVAVAAAYRAVGGGAVAVRSSATCEDSLEASFAGAQDTFLWVRGEDDVVERVRACWASLYSVASVVYRRRRRLPEEAMAMAVVVQRMVDARCSGVAFTRSPTTGDRSVVTVEGSWGLGSAVVGGEVTPDTWVVSKVTGEILARTVSSKLRQHLPGPAGRGVVDVEVPADLRDQPCLADGELRALAGLARRVEGHYGSAQDLEWALAGEHGPDDDGLYLLQSRPETVWSSREAAPVAVPRPRAFDHVVALLGSQRRLRDQRPGGGGPA